MAQAIKIANKKVKPAMLSEAIGDAISENSYPVLITLIKNAQMLGLDEVKMANKISNMLLSGIKGDFSSDNYSYRENSYSIVNKLNEDAYIADKSKFERSTKNDLNRYLIHLRADTQRAPEKGEIGMKGFIYIDDFTHKLALASNAKIIDAALFLEKALEICTYLLKVGKLTEFRSFAHSMLKEKLLSQEELQKRFHDDSLAALQKGSERIRFNTKAFKNKKRIIEINTFVVEHNIHDFMHLGLIDYDEARRFAFIFRESGITNKIELSKQPKNVTNLVDAINSGDFENVARLSELLRDKI